MFGLRRVKPCLYSLVGMYGRLVVVIIHHLGYVSIHMHSRSLSTYSNQIKSKWQHPCKYKRRTTGELMCRHQHDKLVGTRKSRIYHPMADVLSLPELIARYLNHVGTGQENDNCVDV